MPEYLRFEIGPNGGDMHDGVIIEIYICDGQVWFAHCTADEEICNGERKLYTGDSAEWLEEMEKLKIHRWKKAYNEYRILDGVYWNLDYRKSGWKRTRHFYGFTEYPDNWDEFMELMKELVWCEGTTY